MKTKPKRTKKYTPRAINVNACVTAITRANILRQPVTDDFAGEFEIIVLSALDTVMRGYGTRSEWDSLANALNQGWFLSKSGVGPEAREDFNRAHEAMRRAIPEFNETGRFRFASEEDLHVIEHTLSFWSQQLRLVTIGELQGATEIVERDYWQHREAA